MKLAVVFTVCLVFAGCQGNFFDDLKTAFSGVGDAFSQTLSQVGDQAKVLGNQLLNQATQTGSQLASQALQSLLMGSINALSQASTTSTKRDLQSLTQDAQQLIHEKMQNYQGLFSAAIQKLQDLSKNLQNIPVTQLVSEVDTILAAHKQVGDNLKNELVNGLVSVFGSALPYTPKTKRSDFTDALSSLGQSLTTFFQPHLDAVNGLVNNLGNAIKESGTTLANTLTSNPHVSSMQQSGQAIAQHGQNAVSALQSAITDILQQTLTNIQPHLTNIIQQGAQALTDTVNGGTSAVDNTQSQ